MPSLTLKNIPDPLLGRLREDARRERRSLNQQALYLLERALAEKEQVREEAALQVAAWRRLAGLWQSDRPVREEIAEVYAARTAGRETDL